MVTNLSRKIFGILVLTALSVWSIFTFDIHLGLDLSGGSRIVYRFDFDQAVAEGQVSADEDRQAVLQQTAMIFQKRLDGSGLADIPIYPQGSSEIVVELPDRSKEEVEAVKRTIINQGSLLFRIILNTTDDLGFDTEVEKYRTWSTANPDATVMEFNRLAEVDGGPREGILWFPLADSAVKEESAGGGSIRVAADLAAIPVRKEGVLRGTGIEDPDSWDFSGAGLSYVGRVMDRYGFPAVSFEFDEHRKSAFADFTEEFRKRQMAIILSNEVHSAPVIQDRLPGSGIINGGQTGGGFSQEEVMELVTVLRTGSLRIRPQLESESYVGPSLGQDSIDTGMRSATLGGSVVFAFMICYYWMNGLVACMALLFNAFLLLGALYFTQATLTLPGLAGLVLTIGMAVDANILIFERIREERKRGREVPQAYKNGYDRAFTTIIDANLTTLITAVILFHVGTGPVQGFAATLSLGILTSLFSALVFSKVLMHGLVFGKGKFIKEVKMVGALAGQTVFRFTKGRKVAGVISTILVLASFWIFSKHADDMLGIDFAGGSAARIQMNQSVEIGAVRDALPGFSVTQFQTSSEGAETSAMFLVKKKLTAIQRQAFNEGASEAVDLQSTFKGELESKLIGLLHATDPFPEINTVGPRVSGEIQQKAVQAILLALIAIIIYMNFRFKEYRYGIAAVVAVFHDVLLSLGALAVVASMGWVRIEINLEIIAAFLTIIGYSLNDTIVVFDRIRENLPRRDESFPKIIDLSISQSLNRTILTSVTTFFVVSVLFISNRPMHNVLEGFSFAMLIGVVVGTYSSMFVASPMLLYLDRFAKKKLLKAKDQ